MPENATALAATLRACIREGDEYEAITRAGLKAADLLERQAAQIAALRAGAGVETHRQALEEAACECDRIAGDPRMYSKDHRRGAGQCSAAIRALADKPAAGGGA